MSPVFAAAIASLSQVHLPSEAQPLPGIQLATPVRAPLQTPAQAPGTELPFFRGQVRELLPFRDCLLYLQAIVQARFYRPDLWRYLDPVITAEPAQVRLECFSSCCSVYGRVDFESALFDGYALQQRGTTNVNFNPEFIQGLNSLHPGQRAVLELGSQFMQITTQAGQLKEDKVKLPERWIKAFLQSQALWRDAQCWHSLSALPARQFITRLSGKEDAPRFVTQTRQGLQVLSTRSHRDPALAVAGLHRLALLKPLLPHLQGLKIYSLPSQGTVWVAELPQTRVTLALSASVKHGFSGEGEALRSLSAQVDTEALDFVRQILPSLESFSLPELAQYLETTPQAVLPLADTLAMEGLLGYDVAAGRYFYRLLPFQGLTPQRLKHAQRLELADAVKLEQVQQLPAGLQARAWVQGDQALYHSSLEIHQGVLQSASCTCQWFQTHALQRGPCKHLLALRFAAEAAHPSPPKISEE